jgi:hypothetical protein
MFDIYFGNIASVHWKAVAADAHKSFCPKYQQIFILLTVFYSSPNCSRPVINAQAM